jgi:hypothetical protein
MHDLAARIVTRFHLSIDSLSPYFDAVDRTWGADIDFAQVHKEHAEMKGEKQYSSGQIIRVNLKPLLRNPERKHISTGYLHRTAELDNHDTDA